MWQLKNSKCNRTQKPKMWQNSKTRNVTKHLKSQNTNFKKSNCGKIIQLKLWQNSTAQIVTNLKNSTLIKSFLLRTTKYLNNWWDVFEAAICDTMICSTFVIFQDTGLSNVALEAHSNICHVVTKNIHMSTMS